MPLVVPTQALTRMAMASAPSTATMMAAPHASSVTLLNGNVPLQTVAVGGTAAVVPPVWMATGILLVTTSVGHQASTGKPGKLVHLTPWRPPEWWSSLYERSQHTFNFMIACSTVRLVLDYKMDSSSSWLWLSRVCMVYVTQIIVYTFQISLCHKT